MATTTPNWTLLQVNGSERPIYNDKKCATTKIKPGMVLSIASATTVAPVASADALTSKMIAVEASWENTDQSVIVSEHEYAIGDTVNFVYAQPGDLVYLRVSASQTVSIGSALATSGTAGEVSVETTNKDATIIALAEEAVTTGVGETKRVKARII